MIIFSMISCMITTLLNLRKAELRGFRINQATLVEPFIGKYYSQDYVRRNVLRQTDAEIKEQDELIKQEIKDGKIPDPKEIQAHGNGHGAGGHQVDQMQFKLLLFQLNPNPQKLPKVGTSK